MQLVVNDLSAKFPCPDIKKGQDIMKNFIDTYYLVKNVIDNDSIILDKDYRSFELAENYRMEHWLNDDHIDMEQKRRFRRILNQSHTFDSEEFEQEYQWKLEAEFYHDELTSRSCQFAYETEGVLISFLSDSYWEKALKQLQTEIGGTEAGQVYRRLLELQTAANEMGKKFDKEKLTHATPESKATLQQFEEDHKIMMPDGTRQVFSWHVRFTGGYGGRIFFEPRPKEARIYIGHIGKKLPTVKYN